TKPVTDIALAFLTETGYLKDITAEESAEDHETVEYLNAFWKRMQRFVEGADEPQVRQFIAHLAIERSSGELGAIPVDPHAGPEAVKVLTVHASKGLEFRHVFVVDLVQQRFPAMARSEPIELPDELTNVIIPEGDLHLQEERRLFYVACTRARERLFLTHADDYGGARAKKPSIFLHELELDTTELGEISKHMHGIPLTPKRVDPRETRPTHALPSKLSFTSISDYLTCPWLYHYRHVMRVPISLYGKGQISFGKTIHHTMQRFFDLAIERRAAAQGALFDGASAGKKGSAIPSLQELLDIYEQEWLDEWYKSEDERVKHRALGKAALTKYYEELAQDWPNVIGTETPFTIKIGAVSVNGEIDRMDRMADGSISITDYKTGKKAKTVDSIKKLQLIVYKRAAEEVMGERVSRLAYYHFDGNEMVEVEAKEKDMVTLEDRVQEVSEGIANDRFKEKPGEMQCHYCDYKNICPFKV
ncbi:MAG: PD-(D/E)XK nuclease family protein, partial [Candidatus Uhrbacteria bacterium]